MQEMSTTEQQEHAQHAPHHILGLTIRSRTRIYVAYIVPASLALFVYLVQTMADCALSIQYFRTQRPGFGAGTLCLLIAPAILTCLLVLTSKEHRNSSQNVNPCAFACRQLLQLLFFPLFVIYRLLVRIFWSVEALFHDDDDVARMSCLAKADECTSCELYRLIQAYAQAAPQIILQLYDMLTQDMFRNFETTGVQALCLVFSAIDLAAITTSYQRFESQRRVGRLYPWATPQQIAAQRCALAQNAQLCEEVARKKRDSERTIASFPESDKIMANFRLRNDAEATATVTASAAATTHELHVQSVDEVDNDALADSETKVLLHSPHTSSMALMVDNATDDDKIKVQPALRLQHIPAALRDADKIEILDTVPNTPPPEPPEPPPPSTTPPPMLPSLTLAMPMSQHPRAAAAAVTPPPMRRTLSNSSEATRSKRFTRPLSQLDTFKDMLIVNAQLYIKQHVPRPPKLLITRVDEEQTDERTPLVGADHPQQSPLTPKDVVDFFIPRPTKIVNGIQQDDFAAKTVAFFGWIAFITMRMLVLATFCVFYPRAFFIVLGVHYVVMLLALCLESRFQGKLNRTLVYLLLAYIYIFVLLELRVKFKRVRVWYALYLTLVLIENIVMSAVWYGNADFESWWFGFIWEWIVYSGILFLATILVYYCILKPKDVMLIMEDNGKQTQAQHNMGDTGQEAGAS